MSNFCPNCGAKIREDAKFCASCGQKISDDSSPPEDALPHYKEDVTFQEKFLTSEGRLNRWRYFCRTTMLAAPALLLYLMSIGSAYHAANTYHHPALASAAAAGNQGMIVGALGAFVLYCLFAFVPGVMLAVRRLHDLNLSGWYYLLSFVPVVNVPFWLYVMFAPGTVGANKYGADPLENERR